MKTFKEYLQEGLLSDIGDALEKMDTTTKTYDVFNKLLKSNESNFKINLDKFVKDIKKLGAQQQNAKSRWYNMNKNWILVDVKSFVGITAKFEFTSILFVNDLDKNIWGEISLASNLTTKESNLTYLSNKTNRLRNLSKNTYAYNYTTYETYKLPDELEPAIKIMIDKINERL